jgi:integral membrane protein (TIGR00529 family)
MPIPAIAKILIVFAGMLVAHRARLPLGAAVIAGGVALDFWSGRAAAQVAADLGRACVSAELWLFLVITGLIVEFGRFLTEDRNAGALLSAIRRWGGRHGRAWSLMAVPSVIGLIPMPAGALFSAPLVGQAVTGPGWSAEWKSAVNYWFRHTWEYWWPLYPGIIVAMSVFGIETWQFMAGQLPFTPVAIGAGYWFLIRPYTARLAGVEGGAREGTRRALLLLVPVAVVVLCSVLLPFVLAAVIPGVGPQIRRMWAMVIGMAIGLVLIAWDERRSEEARIFRDLLKPKSLSVLFVVAGILIFKSMLDRSGLLPVASRELIASGIPVVLAVAVLPFAAGMVTGLALGFTGAAFPLVVGLMHAGAGGLTPLSTLALAYGFGYTGMMLSPIHLCFIVTKDYFSAPWVRFYRQVFPCAAAVLLFSMLLHALYGAFGW